MCNCLKSLILALFVASLAACQPQVKPDSEKSDATSGKSGGDKSPSEKSAEQTTPEAKPAAEAEVVIPVQAEKPRRGNISAYFETPSRIEAENRVQVMAESVGECVEIRVDEGDRVKAGDILAELDKLELQATIGQTQVQVRQQKAALDVAERSLAEGLVSKVERDNARFAYEQSLANLSAQNVRLSKLTIRAPISGIVTKRNIQAGQMVSGSQPVFNIVDPSTFMVVINPPEKDLPRLEIGQPAKVTIDAFPDQEFTAKVRRINPAVDSVNGTVKVVLDFDTAVRENLREAAFARVRLVLATHENALLIAKDTLVEENARKYVFTVSPVTPEAGKEATSRYTAERIEVQTGLEDSNNVEILTGVDDSSLLVTLGQHTLKSGSIVTVTNAKSEIDAKASMGAEEALQAAKEERKNQAAKKLSSKAEPAKDEQAAKEEAAKGEAAKAEAAKAEAAKAEAAKAEAAKAEAVKAETAEKPVAKEQAAKQSTTKKPVAKAKSTTKAKPTAKKQVKKPSPTTKTDSEQKNDPEQH